MKNSAEVFLGMKHSLKCLKEKKRLKINELNIHYEIKEFLELKPNWGH